jgi:hypothetical protein
MPNATSQTGDAQLLANRRGSQEKLRRPSQADELRVLRQQAFSILRKSGRNSIEQACATNHAG